jgi:F-type H+-transporting ATPase subunit b
MLIDWFTVGAQALNFLILVWLLKRFLYKPILNAVDAREKLIAAKLADAAAKEAEAQKERDAFQQRNEAFDHQRAELMRKATDEANAERQRLLDDARKAADTLSAKRQDALSNDARTLHQALRRRTEQEVFAIAGKALTDLASSSLEERMGEVFTSRVRAMEGRSKERVAQGLVTAKEPALVRSAFDLPAAQRTAIQKALNETFSREIPLRFETTNGQKVAWSIADYLTSLQTGVEDLLKDKDTPRPSAAPKPAVNAKAAPRTKVAPKPRTASKSKKAKPETKHP